MSASERTRLLEEEVHELRRRLEAVERWQGDAQRALKRFPVHFRETLLQRAAKVDDT